MQFPDQKTVVVDSDRNVRYEVLAYRKLTQHEAVGYVRFYMANTPKRKRLKKNSVVQLMTTIGD